MGYTHYWKQKRNFSQEEWEKFCECVKSVTEYATEHLGIALLEEYDLPDTKPYIGKNFVRFNGADNDGHETFLIERCRAPKESWQHERGLAFCKTTRKPYDVVVVALLAYLNTCIENLFEVNSDGRASEWMAGVDLARKAFNPCSNEIDIPMILMQKDVWATGYFCHYLEVDFRVGKAVDGYFYVVRNKDGAAYRLNDEAQYDTICKQIEIRYNSNLNHRGWVDKDARANIKRSQARYLNDLVNNAPLFNRNQKPPTFIRPIAPLEKNDESIYPR